MRRVLALLSATATTVALGIVALDVDASRLHRRASTAARAAADSGTPWSVIGRVGPNLAGSTWVSSVGDTAGFVSSATLYPRDGVLSTASGLSSLIRYEAAQNGSFAGDGFAAVIGLEPTTNAVLSVAGGFEVVQPIGGLSTGIAPGMFGGLWLTESLGSGLPFPDPRNAPNTILVGVSAVGDATPAGDLDLIAVDAGGVSASARLVGARSDLLQYIRVRAPPGGGRVEATVYRPATGATFSAEVTQRLPAIDLAPILAVNNEALGTASYAIGPMLWAAGGEPGARMVMPAPFASLRAAWMDRIGDAELRAMVVGCLTDPASPFDWSIGPSGGGAMAGYGVPWTTFAPSVSNAGEFIELTSGTAEDQPAGVFSFPNFVTSDAAKPITRREGYCAFGLTQHATNFGAAGVRGVLLGSGHGGLGEGTLDTSELFGFTYPDNRTDGILFHTRASYEGAAATQVVLESLGGERDNDAEYEVFVGAYRDADWMGAVLYRADTDVIVYAARVFANLPPADLPADLEFNASGGVGAGPLPTRVMRFRAVGRSRDWRQPWR